MQSVSQTENIKMRGFTASLQHTALQQDTNFFLKLFDKAWQLLNSYIEF